MGYLSRVLYKSSAVHENSEAPFGFWKLVVAFAEDLSFLQKFITQAAWLLGSTMNSAIAICAHVYVSFE